MVPLRVLGVGWKLTSFEKSDIPHPCSNFCQALQACTFTLYAVLQEWPVILTLTGYSATKYLNRGASVLTKMMSENAQNILLHFQPLAWWNSRFVFRGTVAVFHAERLINLRNRIIQLCTLKKTVMPKCFRGLSTEVCLTSKNSKFALAKLSILHDPNTNGFKRILIYFHRDTQNANFGEIPLIKPQNNT